MTAMNYDLPGGAVLRVGYRTPGLSDVLDATGKMALAQELGMTVVEPQLADKEFPHDGVADELARAAEAHGVTIPSLGAFPPLTDPGGVAAGLAIMERAIRLARTMGADYIFVLAAEPPAGLSQPETWALMEDNLRRWADLAGAAGIALAMEPEWYVGSVERLGRLLERVGHNNLYANFDPTNLYLAGSDPLEAFDRFGERIRSGHIKDGVYRSDRKGEVPVGEGEVDYAAILRVLVQRGRDMNLFIEHCSAPEQVRQGAAVVRDFMAGIV